MATREENLKKINEELDLLSDEQLEDIAGGWKIHLYPLPHFEADANAQEPQNDEPNLTIQCHKR